MTAILGYADGTHVWIGGDSAANNGTWARFSIQERKVFRLDDRMVVGVCGRWRVCQLIQMALILPQPPAEAPDIDYLALCFVPAVQALLKQHDEVMKNEASGTGVMIGYHGVLYHMDTAFNVNAPARQVFADGSGGDLALGAFVAYTECGVDVENAMLRALAVTGRHDLTVDAPYYVEKL